MWFLICLAQSLRQSWPQHDSACSSLARRVCFIKSYETRQGDLKTRTDEIFQDKQLVKY